ncbi:MAG: protein kinase [Polyangiaceae bacterium]|nr:protein kinase [Polyangiaceae bacterium]
MAGTPSDDAFLGVDLPGGIRLVSLIGRGATARVYEGFQAELERRVAVKVLDPSLAKDATMVRRFRRESRVAASILHPHVVSVLFLTTLPDETPAMVLELLDGETLTASRVAAGGSMPLDRALRIALSIADAVGEGHDQGVVHRDLKPDNVLLVRRGRDRDYVKVLDFGLARVVPEAEGLTRQGQVFGTPRYMSPEAAQGLPVGPAGDVYSIAVVLFELLAGRAPFESDSAVGYLLAHTSQRPPGLAELAPEVPAAIAAVVDRALSKSPADRPADARALGGELVAALRASDVDERRALSFRTAASLRAASQLRQGAPTLAHAGASGTLAEPAAVAPSTPPPPSVATKTLADHEGFGPAIPPLAPTTVSPIAVGADEQPTRRLPVEPLDAPEPVSEDGAPRPPLWRTILLVAACFIIGAGGATLGATRLGLVAPAKAPLSRADALYAEASEALARRDWDTPAQRCVRDLVIRARAEHPGDPRFDELGRRASLELTALAAASRQAGEASEAERQVRAALAIDPSNSVAASMLRDLTRIPTLTTSAEPPKPKPRPEPARGEPHPSAAPSGSAEAPRWL